MSDDEDPFDIDNVEGSEDVVPSPISLVAPPEDEHEEQQAEEGQASDNQDEDGVEDEDEFEDGDEDGDEVEGSDEDGDDEMLVNDIFGVAPKVKRLKKVSRRTKKSEFIDDEAELSGDDDVSADELDSSDDDDKVDTTIVDLDAKELGSDEEEEIRRLYHKQLETEDRRKLLLLQEQLEENDITTGYRRRKKFRWQTKELMENSLRRHYDPDDDDSQEGDDDDDFDYSELNQPRLKRPTAESILIGTTSIMAPSNKGLLDSDESDIEVPRSYSRGGRLSGEPRPGTSYAMSDDSNSNTISRVTHPAIRPSAANGTSSDLNRFLFRDKELVEALSTKEIVITTREEKERVIQREIRRVLQSKSIFDQLYS